MKYLQISTVMASGSISRIMRQNYDEKKAQGWECLIAYGRGKSVKGYNSVRIGNDVDVVWQGVETRLFDRHGYGSKSATRDFLKQADDFNPDIVHLHNLHGYYINFELLFAWLKKHPERTVWWTLHDCWSFTGHCAYFTAVGCDEWKKECRNCRQTKKYPTCNFYSNVQANFSKKKRAFSGVKNMTIITPSKWLADLVKQSFLKEYPVEVRYNIIDTEIFKPTPSDFKLRAGIKNRKMILGVANVWEERKGLEDLIKLATILDDTYVIVLVGLTEKQISHMPKNVIGYTRTSSAKELAEIYTAADVFVNPTYEDNYPTVNLEAEACGTRVITYDTGGCRETVKREDSKVIPVGGINELLAELKRIEEIGI